MKLSYSRFGKGQDLMQRPFNSEATGLRKVGEIPAVAEYLRAVLRRRSFMLEVPFGTLRSQNMDTVLGNLWHLLNPLMLLAVYFFIFGVILPDVRRGLENFLGFLAIGIFMFQYSQKSFLQGAKSIISNEGLIRAISFPRAILPCSAVIAESLAFLPSMFCMLAFAVATGERATLAWLLIIPIVALQSMFNLGGAFVVARLTNWFRDVENVLPFVFRLLFYASGVLFPVSRVISDESSLRLLFVLNPIYCYLTMARGVLMGLPIRADEITSGVAWSAALLVIGFMFFRKGEREYGRGPRGA